MAFNSLEFILFLPFIVLLYWVIPHKFRWILLLAASILVYMSFNAWFIIPIAVTICVSYSMSLLTAKTENRKKRKAYLIITITVCLGILIFFKYFEFLMQSVIDLINVFRAPEAAFGSVVWKILLPIGISFYTFQTLSYVIDVYKGKIAPEKHFGYYALYVIYFPQVFAGPIERPDKLLPQLKEKKQFNNDDMIIGFRWLLCGYIKKMVIADFLAVFVNNVFGNVAGANAISIFVAGLLFSIQIYCDFAGYTDIALGAARMMGIRLTKNFDRPFSATSPSQFVQRWHISLNAWFRDYVYIPLGGSRKGKFRQCLNVFIVFALCGLWHGADWSFVLWGLVVAACVILETILHKPLLALRKKSKLKEPSRFGVLLRRAAFFIGVIFINLIFRAENIGQLGQIYGRFFTTLGLGGAAFKAAIASLNLNYMIVIRMAAVFFVLALLPHLTDFENGITPPAAFSNGPLADCGARSRYSRRLAAYLFGIILIALAWLILLSGGGASDFVYFQF